MNTTDEFKKTVSRLLDEFILPHQGRIDLGKERQIKFFAHEKNNQYPVFIEPDKKTVNNIERAFPEIPEEDVGREFAMKLLQALKYNAMYAATNHDRAISIFPAFGCSASLTSLGLQQKRSHEKYGEYGPPDPLGQDEALKLTLDDVQVRGDFKKRIDFIKYAREMTDDKIPILSSYTGGPFTMACQLMGTDFLMLTATDSKLAHEFLDFCSAAMKKLLFWLRDAGGADEYENTPLGGGLVSGGARAMQMDIDEAVMFSPAAIDEFIIPSVCKFAEKCGISVQMLHYCGWHEPFSRAIANEKSIAALNNNPVPSQAPPPFEEVMKLCEESGTLNANSYPMYADEHPKDYLKRLHKWAKKGILLPNIKSSVYKDEYFKSSAEAADCWYQM